MKNHNIFCILFYNSCRSNFMIIGYLFVFAFNINAQDKIFINHGDWNVASNWSPSGVPTSTQTVGIGSNYNCTIPAGYAAECANLSLTTNADIVIQNTGSLTVTAIFITSPAMQAYNGTTITNAGDLNVFGISGGSGNTALQLNGATVTNENTGKIYINKAATGFSIIGTVYNHGLLSIGNTSDAMGTAMSINGVCTNYQNAMILIHKASGTGISCSSGDFINKGTCQIAISGTVNTGIFVANPMTNDTTGTITISGAVNNGFSEPNLFSSGHVTNKGSITISTCTYGLAARFTNTHLGTMTINNCTRGISLSYSGGASSNAGTIHIGTTGSITTYGILQTTNADLTNTGIINIDNANFGMGINDSGTQFVNSGTVKIGNNANIGTTGIELYTSAILTNNIGGVIEINRCTGYAAMTIANFPTLNNSGTIRMGNLQNIGGGIITWWSSQINNTSTGVIEINNSSWVGINVAQSGTLFNNSGTITAGNIASAAKVIYCEDGGDFNNNTSGVINANNLSISGVSVSGIGTIFNNYGLIQAGNIANIVEFGIHILNNGTFTNQSSGTININKVNTNWWSRPIFNENGVFTNNGVINIGNIGTFVTCSVGIYSLSSSTNNGTITINNTNFGAIELFNSSIFQNNGNIIIGNIKGSHDIGILIEQNSTFTNGNMGDIEINDVNFNWWSKAIFVADGVLNNSGSIDIGSLALCSFGIYFNKNFNNLAGGVIDINRITFAGIEGHTSLGSGSNNGQITIGSSIGCGWYGISLHENSSFVNQAAGIITINNGTTNWWTGGILVKTSLFSNLGIIRFGTLSDLNEGIQLGENATDTGTFTNSGTLEFDRISDISSAGIFCDVNTIFTNNITGIIKFGYNQPVQVAFRGGGTATNFGQLLCKNIVYSTVMTGQTLYNKVNSTFQVFTGFVNYIDGTLLQATGSTFKIDGTLNNFGTVIATVD
ncbi:MAG: hypothetical protein IPO92_09730 [Saprospiraceae bacterium]|nr:hypothetical protein [Saprospiraceae bacterium]